MSVLSQCREAAREYIGGLDGLRRFFARHENVFKISGDRRVQKLINPTITPYMKTCTINMNRENSFNTKNWLKVVNQSNTLVYFQNARFSSSAVVVQFKCRPGPL